MIFATQTHNCFLCENKLTDKYVLWNKQGRIIKGKAIYSDKNMIHGKTVICGHCGLVQEYEPMTEKCLHDYYKLEYRNLFPYPENQGREHDRNAINVLKKNSLLSMNDYILIVGEYSDEWNDFPFKERLGVNFSYKRSIYNSIVCLNTLEHVYNPIEFLSDLSGLITEYDYIYITVPNLLSKTINLPRDIWFSNNHIYHFTQETLLRCCHKAGLKEEFIFNFTESFGDKIGVVLRKQQASKTPEQLIKYVNLCENLHNILNGD